MSDASGGGCVNLYVRNEKGTLEMKATSVRLEEPLADALEMIAEVEGVSVSDEIRRAIGDYVARKRDDDTFKQRLAARLSMEQQKAISVFGELPPIPEAV